MHFASRANVKFRPRHRANVRVVHGELEQFRRPCHVSHDSETICMADDVAKMRALVFWGSLSHALVSSGKVACCVTQMHSLLPLARPHPPNQLEPPSEYLAERNKLFDELYAKQQAELAGAFIRSALRAPSLLQSLSRLVRLPAP